MDSRIITIYPFLSNLQWIKALTCLKKYFFTFDDAKEFNTGKICGWPKRKLYPLVIYLIEEILLQHPLLFLNHKYLFLKEWLNMC